MRREELPVDTAIPSYRPHRYPAKIIVLCVRLYVRFPLSYRGVEEMMVAPGVVVSYTTIRRWCHTFGPLSAATVRRRRPQPKDTWHLDELHPKCLAGRSLPVRPTATPRHDIGDVAVQFALAQFDGLKRVL